MKKKSFTHKFCCQFNNTMIGENLRSSFFNTVLRNIFNILIITLVSFSFSCKRNPLDINISGIDLEINIQRFEKELFSVSTDSIAETIAYFYEKYDDFFDVFSFHVINIGHPSEKEFPGNLGMFITDRLNREVFNATMQIFPGLEKLESTFTRAFKRYKYHFPEREIPEIVSYISRFNHSHFTVGNYLGIGLDKYLGAGNEYYTRMGLPRYQRINMFSDKLPSDVLYAFASIEVLYNDSVDNLLNRIIHQGKLMYFVDALLPDEPDSLKIGFTIDQMIWCQNNERQMWEYLIEKNLLFSSDPMVIQKITGSSPFTYYFTGESPGRTGVWIGWQIIREYAKRNKDLSLAEIMDEKDYHKILRESRYNP